MHSRWSAVSLVLFASTAGGAETLVYRVPEGCPSRELFVAAVEKRGGSIAGRSLEVDVRRDGEEFVGSLVIGNAKPREVRGAACVEVVDALAVAAVDGAETEALAPLPPYPDHLRADAQISRTRVTVPAGTLLFQPAINITAFGGVVYGVLPGVVVPRYDLEATRASFVTTPDGAQLIVGPIIRLRFSYFGEATYHTADASVVAQGFTAGIGACLSPHYDSSGWELLFCSDFAAGATQLKVRDASGNESSAKTAPNGTVGVGVEGQRAFGYFHVSAKIGIDVPFAQLSPTGARGEDLFRSSSLTAHFMLGAGGHF